MKTATTKNKLFSPVEMVETDKFFKGMEIASDCKQAVVIHLPEGKKVVNFCSKGYALVPCKELVTPFEKALNEVGKFEAKYWHDGFAKFYIDYLPEGIKAQIGKGDNVIPRLRLTHSYNSTLPYQLEFGYYRQICSNGLMGYGYETKFKMKHTAQVADGKALEKTLDAASGFLKSANENANIYRKLAGQRVVNVGKRLEEIFEHNTRAPKRQREAIMERVAVEQSQLGLSAANDWLLYNAINFQFNHNEEVNTPEEIWNEADRGILRFMANAA